MLDRIEVFLRRFHRSFNRAKWAVRLLRLKQLPPGNNAPGLLLIQIDGLAFPQFQQALKDGRLPFLHRLIQRQGYRLHSLYSGLPSATPGVQGELFYGVKGCVPSFSFLVRKDGRIRKMYDPRSVQEVEKSLAKQGQPLLEGGSAYCDIFSGGAAECHYSAAKRGWDGILRVANPLIFPFFLLLFANVVVRIARLLIWEFAVALFEALRGALKGFSLIQELEFISIRLSVCVFLREMLAAAVPLDIARGLPVIHLNFFGYDETSHRRGPGSKFAHWALPGIDAAAARIWRAARQTGHRSYDLWVYSDHGQEETVPYSLGHSKTLEQAVSEILRRDLPDVRLETVAGMGPIAHLYLSRPLNESERERLARALVESAGIPTILAPAGPGKAAAWNGTGTLSLPEDAARVLGPEHPFLAEAAQDLVSLCHHARAGTLLALGWRPGQPAKTFPMENGSHAGPGSQETHAFALLPPDAPVDPDKPYLRPLDLRRAALRFLGRLEDPEKQVVSLPGPAPAARPKLRIMTYNVHNCFGLDGKLSPERIARVIARHQPDAVALQELDVNRLRTGRVDQAEQIAKKLRMTFHFHTSFRLADEQYGNAIFSRFPMRLIRAGGLPRLPGSPVGEPRSALWVELDVHGSAVHLINTHLSLWPAERLLQAEALLGPEWVGSREALGPFLLCGDFNSTPGSAVYRRLTRSFRDAQLALKKHSPRGTWFGRHPFSRIDHILISPGIEVLEVVVSDTELDQAASDHLPLLAELRILLRRKP
ncbi:MAG: endonuclease/exonuclease/phosphatase family protein [Candidatus Omnitrophota bacterium]|nr:endonuclease/exonuclease/phosphatase family protein [Candidatus Omnitrophota bacterium]